MAVHLIFTCLMRALNWLVVIAPFIAVHGATLTVGTGGQYSTLSAAAQVATAGDTLLVLDGLYNSGTQWISNLSGTAAQPIVIRAQNRHQAIFRGGTEAIHFTNCAYIEIRGLVIEQQTGNGINIDDGGDYQTPAHHFVIDDCLFRDMQSSGNSDLLKLSGLDDFVIRNCNFVNGSMGGSGIDMVGCHRGIIEDNILDGAGISGIQAKGGTQHILIRRNVLMHMPQRALNLGGSTGLQYFRPPLPSPITDAFEAADLQVYANIFVGSWAPVAYVGCVRAKVNHNTIFKPANWVIRILQETTVPGFLPCGQNEFRNNVVYLTRDLAEVNVGPNTDAQSFLFSNNLWFNEQGGNWTPGLPVAEANQVIANPQFIDTSQHDFRVVPSSPAVQMGAVLDEPDRDFLGQLYHQPPSIGAHEGFEITTTTGYFVAPNYILVGPNPSDSEVTVSGDFSDAFIQVVNLAGQVVQDHSNAQSQVTINLNALPAGVYFLRIASKTHQQLEIVKLIKM